MGQRQIQLRWGLVQQKHLLHRPIRKQHLACNPVHPRQSDMCPGLRGRYANWSARGIGSSTNLLSIKRSRATGWSAMTSATRLNRMESYSSSLATQIRPLLLMASQTWEKIRREIRMTTMPSLSAPIRVPTHASS